jgi:hypothetical protein
MPRYSLAGLILVTDTAMPELVEVEQEIGMVWRFASRGDASPGHLPLVHKAETEKGTVWLRIERDAERYVLRFTDIADFVVTPAERSISCFSDEEVGSSTVRHLLLDQVVPHILALDGSMVLHASAVATDGGVVAFVGPSGFGKSSLAASFTSGGCPLVSDDFVLLVEDEVTGRFAAVPSYPGLRLWPDSAEVFGTGPETSVVVSEMSDKRRVPARGHDTSSAPMLVRALVVLGDPSDESGERISVRRISAREGLMAVYQQAFRMERSGRERQLLEFDRFARLASSTVLLRVDYPREYESLPAVRAAILDALTTASYQE